MIQVLALLLAVSGLWSAVDDSLGVADEFVSAGIAADSLVAAADRCFEREQYLRAAALYGRVYRAGELDEHGLFRYAVCLNVNGDYQRALSVVNEIEDYEYFEQRLINIYGVVGNVYRYNHLLRESIEYFKLAVSRFPEQSPEETAGIFGCLGEVYSELGEHGEAMEYFLSALRYREIGYQLAEGYLLRDCLGELERGQQSYRERTDLIDYEVYNYLNELQLMGRMTMEDFLPRLTTLAGSGNTYAQRRCYADGIEFYYQ